MNVIGSALIRRCDICNQINAIDLDGTPEHEREMELPDHTISRVSESEATRLWKTAGKCNHKKLIEDLRSAPLKDLLAAERDLVKELLNVRNQLPHFRAWIVIYHPLTKKDTWLRDYLLEIANYIDDCKLNSGLPVSASTPSDEQMAREAAEKTIHQYLTDCLTPDRKYSIPTEHILDALQRKGAAAAAKDMLDIL